MKTAAKYKSLVSMGTMLLATAVLVCGFKSSNSQDRARKIMGSANFFGVGEAIKYYGVDTNQIAELSEVPFPDEVLAQCKDTHILVAVFPLSILDILEKHNLFYRYDTNWYRNEPFAKERGKVGWQLIQKFPVEGSISNNWQAQQMLIASDCRVPTAQAMVYTIVGHFLATNERLFEKVYVRTSSEASSDGYVVYVGFFGSEMGLDVSGGETNHCGLYLGVAAARK